MLRVTTHHVVHLVRLVRAAALGGVALGGLACGGDAAGPAVGSEMALTVTGLRPLEPATEGSYELWVYPASGDPVSGGRFQVPAGAPGGEARVEFVLPVEPPARVAVTVEPPGDADGRPSASELLAGVMRGGTARLRIEGSVTDGRPFEREPGHHSLFTTSNNVALGYPSYENAGLWLFSISVEVNRHRTREVKLTPLLRGWLYEGWIVYRPGTPEETWIPYGKFRPDRLGLLTSRDNTGSGYFSGDDDFVNAGVEDVPGEEWTTDRVADHLGLRMPGGLQLPLTLDAVDPATGEPVWYHVITVEPVFDEDEPPLADQPFLLQPYRNPIGAGGPGLPRSIIHLDNDPTAEVRPAR